MTRHSVMLGVLLPLIAAGQPKTIWDGVYNQAQQDRGATAYTMYCSQCHGEALSGTRGALRGAKFMDRWREDNLNSLFTLMKTTMPPGPRGRVSAAEYLDIVAYVLAVNEFPAGKGELALNDLEGVLVVGKEGPK